MRVLIQRVLEASVIVEDVNSGSIKNGLLVFAGIEDADTDTDILWISKKIVNLRIFNDAAHIPNLSVRETEGDILVVSQFTLHASTRKGNRPSYIRASKPQIAKAVYQKLVQQLQQDLGKKVATGVFGADMLVSLINDGPLTIWMDSRNKE